MSNDFIPTKDSEYQEWTGNLMNNLGQNLKKFSIPDAAYSELKNLYDDFCAKYATACDLETRTPIAVTNKIEVRKAFTSALRLFLKSYISFNSAVSDGDRRAMGLPIYDRTHTPVPPPTTYPDITIDSGIIRRLRVNFRDHNSANRGKPKGATGSVIRWVIMDTPPSNVDEFANTALATRSPHNFDFNESQRGKSVYFCVAWQNNKGEKGPWSEIVSAIVP